MKEPLIKSRALKFVLLIGVMSFFADFTYEGSRSIIGPYLALFGASAVAVAFITGFGELLGYGLRLVSGRLSDRTGKFWPITIFGYIIQMFSVPLLALAGNWQVAALLIIIERVGKATRNPPRDVMLSHAAKEMGYGWGFGVHEALDQSGALFGPLVVAAVLAIRGQYQIAFAVLLIPALITLSILAVARLTYPRPEEMETNPPDVKTSGLPRIFWVYLAAAVLVATGFADFPFIAYHFARASIVPGTLIPVFYAVAMGVSGAGSLLFGRLFDRFGISVLIPLTVLSALFAPLVFLGNFWVALVGVALWGLGMGVHESIIPAAVALMVPAQRRASAYGLFTAGYGIFWFLGSVMIGVLYGISIPALIAFSLVVELAAIPLIIIVRKQMRPVNTAV
ncbi:MAG TPA: MFS transporter [Ktedonobacteraceae bacterium]|nr:MFS transporter [Ktedonobacteraceae bacterium]